MRTNFLTCSILVAAVGACDSAPTQCELNPDDVVVSLTPTGFDDAEGRIDDSSGFTMAPDGRVCGVLWKGNEGELVCSSLRDGLVVVPEVVPSAGSRPLIAFDGDILHVVYVHAFTEVLRATVSDEGVSVEAVSGCDTPGGAMVVSDGVLRLLCDSGELSSVASPTAGGAWQGTPVAQPDIAAMSARAAVRGGQGGQMYGVFGVQVPAEPGVVAYAGTTQVELRLVGLPVAGEAETVQLLAHSNGFGLLDFIFTPDGRFAVLTLVDTDTREGVAQLELALFTGRVGEPASLVRTSLGELPGRRFRGRLTADGDGRLFATWFQYRDGAAGTPLRSLGFATFAPGTLEPATVVYIGDSESSLLGGFLGPQGMLDLLRIDLDEDGRAFARGLVLDTDNVNTPLATLRFPACQ